ncbi:RluA family pseudouridine synthase [Candidatus Parcubacteria bacterium]|nr:RluA family pseudouridine synthase [Patescibacteria group bacterium]MCG2694186.1 RluA family pseudouridine synthase [Candidatus Parcubacteria bacterium]
MSIIKVKKEDKDKRLDKFLIEKMPEHSRSYWQKQIKAGLVLVNNKQAKVHEFLKENNKVSIKQESKRTLNKKNKIQRKYNLLHENKNYLIVEKPAGMLTHRTGGEEGLADALLKDYPEIEGVGEKYRWGIVHRLDRDVSGVLLVARTKEFFKYIKKQFKERKVKKNYLALVYGEIQRDEDDINFVIARAKEGKMAARPEEGEGKEATTHFDVLHHYKNYTFLCVQILTGRTHQIRAHMLAYGYPVVGDRIYRARLASRRNKIKIPCEMDRIFLHSHIIGFNNLKGERVEYESKLPKELKDCLKELK